MSLFLSKLLPVFVYPLGLVCVLIVVAVVLARRRRLQRFVLLSVLLLLLLSSNRWVSMGLARSLEWRYLPPDEVPEAEVIVLLGGGTVPSEPPRKLVEVNGSGDRLLYALWLFQQGKAETILLSGGLLDWDVQTSTPAQDMAELLKLMGIPSESLWLQTESRNTYEDALFCARLLKTKGIQRILLVTSAWHMPRAVKLFQAQGLEVIPLSTDFTVTEAGWRQLKQGDFRSQILALLPSVDNLSLTTRIMKEYIGMFVNDTLLSRVGGST